MDPEQSLKGLRSAEASLLSILGSRTGLCGGVSSGPASGCPAYIYIDRFALPYYIYICLRARLPPQILALFGKDKFDMFNISAI